MSVLMRAALERLIQPNLIPFRAPPFGLTRLSSSTTGDEDDVKEARAWLQNFDAETIPRSICDFSFSRSSGPGGQNVNKVNSKATMRVSLSTLQSHVPKLLWSGIASSRYAADRSGDLIIQSDDSRKQQENVQRCLLKLHELVKDAARDAVPGETTPEQKNRVKALEKSNNERRIKAKKIHSSKKSARRSSGDD